jgi:hypothetical protein
MKRIFTVLFAAIIACALYSCSKGQNSPAETVDFGIHRVIKPGELPAGLSATLEKLNIRLETDSLSPFYGYIDNNQLNI